jgi:hypothetical protein
MPLTQVQLFSKADIPSHGDQKRHDKGRDIILETTCFTKNIRRTKDRIPYGPNQKSTGIAVSQKILNYNFQKYIY